MIVQGVILGAIAYKLFVAPTKAAVAVSKMVDHHLDKPKHIVLQDDEGDQISFPAADFFDGKGRHHTDFLVGKVRTKDGQVEEVVLSKSEVEMLQFVSFAEDRGMEVPKPALRSLCKTIKNRRDEVTRSPSRKVTRKGAKKKKSKRKKKAA